VINVNGDATLNSAFQLGNGFGDIDLKRELPNVKDVNRLIKSVSMCPLVNQLVTEEQTVLIIIDEASMVSNALLYCVIMGLERANVNYQIILVGDVLQNAPVKAEYYFKPLFIRNAQGQVESRQMGINLTRVRLEENMRQSGDESFFNDLSAVRIGEKSLSRLPVIKSRIQASLNSSIPEDALHIFPSNADIKQMNERRTAEMIEAGAHHKTYVARVRRIAATNDNWMRDLAPIEERMVLCVGMPVMIRINLKEDGEIVAGNGSTGTITALYNESVDVRLHHDNSVISVKMQKLHIAKDARGRTPGEFIQLPLHPAFAISGHKVQGATITGNVVIHHKMASGRPIPPTFTGWVYVVTSRVTNSKGLWFHLEGYDDVASLMNSVYVDKDALHWVSTAN
jgi:hypothetical protein